MIVPCSARKHEFRQRAEFLYQGSLFQVALKAAVSITDRWKIGVLSAKHGFVRLHDQLDPYDTQWGDPDAATAKDLRESAERIRWKLHPISPVVQDPVVLLLPRAYATRALRIWPEAIDYFAGCRGIGDMRHRLAVISEATFAIPKLSPPFQPGGTS